MFARVALALALWTDPGPDPPAVAPDAAPPATEIEFDGEDSLGGDDVTTRRPDDVKFDPLLRDRYQVDERAPDTSLPTRDPPRRGCGGCAAADGGASGGAGDGWLLVLFGLALLARRLSPWRAPSARCSRSGSRRCRRRSAGASRRA